MKPLAERVAEFFARRPVLSGEEGVVAISGGADSVALAWLCRQLVARGVLRAFSLAHLNHCLRGDESDGDEAFVVDLAGQWKLPIATERIDVAALAVGRNLEQTAREVRYVWLTRAARERGAGWVATAHTMDDQAETVLHHVLRGTGLAGLAGVAEEMPSAGGVALVRPLLDVRRDEIASLLAEEKVGYRVDSMNSDARYTRTRLRREILPLLRREINPAVDEALARLATQARECQAAVNGAAALHLVAAEKPRAGGVLVFDLAVLAGLDPFWVREMFRLVWKREGWPAGEMNADDWRRFDALVAGTQSAHDFPAGVRARVLRHVLQIWR